MKVICSHVQHCTEPERSGCSHSVAHNPGEYIDRICNITKVTCNAGSDGDVICQPIPVINLIEATDALLRFIENNDVEDEMAYDGDGHIDTWTSGEFEELLSNAKEKLKEINEEML